VAVDYTVDTLVSRVKRTLQLRGNNAKLTTAELVQVCDEEIQQNLFPQLMTVREDFQVSRIVQTLIEGAGEYRTPHAAAASTIDHIDVATISGGAVTAARLLPRVETPDLALWAEATPGQPRAYALLGDTIQLLPAPDATTASTYALVIYHDTRPSNLILTNANCLVVVSSEVSPNDPADLQIVVEDVGIYGDGDVLDVVPNVPPLMPFVMNAEVTFSDGVQTLDIAPGYFKTSAGLAAVVGAGAYMTPPGQTCVFPLPDAWWSVAIDASAARAAMITGDPQNHTALRGESNAAIERLINLLSSRVRKQPHATFNRASPMRRGAYPQNGRWYR
jgi:hypothetical protein